jgi:muramoyltetrapeptide carboxypeptidase
MKIIKPKKLEKGDVIGLISPASTPEDMSKIDNAVKYFEDLGYNIKVGHNVGRKNGYLAGDDDERADDIHEMFSDKSVKAVIAIRGGFGSTRLLDKINYNLIKRNPKIFIGYSDLTALNIAIFKKTGLITFEGPMAATDFGDNIDPYTEEWFWRIVSNKKKIGKVFNPDGEKFYKLSKGRGIGRIIGGNLSILTSLAGTQYFPDFKDAILLLEEINEEPYRVDRMLNHLRLLNVYNKVNGIILGRFVNCFQKAGERDERTLNTVILDYFENLGLPLIYNVSHGHVKKNFTLPIGIMAKVNASRDFVEITESAVE